MLIRRKAIILFLILFSVIGDKFIEASSGKNRKLPNILLITLDTTRADHLPCYGYSVNTTPYLCQLATEKGIIYKKAYSSSPLTLPAHASILTGLMSNEHKILNNGLYKLSKDKITIAKRLKSAGYFTYAYISSAVLDRIYGLDAGFDLYEDSVRVGKREFFDFRERAASQVMDSVEKGVRQWKKPWFVWIHFYDPHDPYVPPDKYLYKFKNPYDGELAFVDDQIKRLFTELENNHQWDFNSDYAFIVGDHGEDLGDFNEMRHGILITTSTIRVPFIILLPDKQKITISEPVSIIDVAPTILKILNLWSDKLHMQGKPLLPSRISLDELFISTFMPYYSFRWSPQIAILYYPYLLIRGSKDELFDIQKDERMQEKLDVKKESIFPKLSKELNKFKGVIMSIPKPTVQDLEKLEKLRSLGYADSVSSDMPKDAFSLPDARDRVYIYKALLDGEELIKNHKWQIAYERLSELILVDPYNTLLLKNLANFYESFGEYQKAEANLIKIKELLPDMDYPYFNLGEFYIRRGRIQEGEQLLRIALQQNPRYADAYLDLFQLAIHQKDLKKAEQLLKEARENNVEDGDLLVYTSIISRDKGNWQEAYNAINSAEELIVMNQRLLIEKANVLCKIDSPYINKCEAFLKNLKTEEKEYAEIWVLAAEWFAWKGKLSESLYCWIEASKRPAGNPWLKNKIKDNIQMLKSKGVSPQASEWF